LKLSKGLQIQVIKDDMPNDALIDNDLICSISKANVIFLNKIFNINSKYLYLSLKLT
jgi:hypothetical protein